MAVVVVAAAGCQCSQTLGHSLSPILVVESAVALRFPKDEFMAVPVQVPALVIGPVSAGRSCRPWLRRRRYSPATAADSPAIYGQPEPQVEGGDPRHYTQQKRPQEDLDCSNPPPRHAMARDPTAHGHASHRPFQHPSCGPSHLPSRCHTCCYRPAVDFFKEFLFRN